MFVAVAHHNTGHGEASSPIIVSDSIVSAVDAARRAEELGFQFYQDETGVAVFQLNREHLHDKGAMRITDPPSETNVTVFLRTKRQGEWREEWWNPKAQERFERELQSIPR